MLIYQFKVITFECKYLFCHLFLNLRTRIIQIWHVSWQTQFKIWQFRTEFLLCTIISLDRKVLQWWFICHFMQNLISFKGIPNMVHFKYKNDSKNIKMLPLPLNFSNAWKNYCRVIKLRVQENKKSYRHETLIDYGHHRCLHSYGINFVSPCLKLSIFFFNFRYPNFN